ncbi:MAG: nucleoside hydrolase [Prolixibacteraceae bacterium]|jgi:inosine-uridine nucleoside N-ribohydrolase|nr:nucleoside hydrolase [Prolixibacteraceae bacterium]
MKNKLVLLAITILLYISSTAQVKIIFDTDFGGDADDLGALAMLHGFVENGDCNLLGIMIWNTEKYVVPAVDAVNRFYKHPNIPIGIRSGQPSRTDFNHTKIIADNLPNQLSYNDVPEVVSLYRKILSENDDSSIVLVTVGPLSNIKDLIQSEGDDYSPLTGKALLHQKVKEMVVMGGQYPEGENEWNFNGNMPGVSSFVFDQIELPVVFSGYELGLKIKTGSVFNQIPKNHPLYLGFHYFSEHAPWMKENYDGKILDNASYDQTAVLYAVKGGLGKWWRKVNYGYNDVGNNGDNKWVDEEHENKKHAYLKLTEDPEKMSEIIESLMMFDLK